MNHDLITRHFYPAKPVKHRSEKNFYLNSKKKKKKKKKTHQKKPHKLCTLNDTVMENRHCRVRVVKLLAGVWTELLLVRIPDWSVTISSAPLPAIGSLVSV
jgi:hypothetical protein